MDLIDRSALLEDVEESVVFTVREGVQSAEIRGANKIIARIKAAPAVDAEKVFEQMGLVKEAFEMAKADLVPVVRCKDCKNMIVVQGFRFCKAWERIQTMGDEGWCCFGERRADDGL